MFRPFVYVFLILAMKVSYGAISYGAVEGLGWAGHLSKKFAVK